MKIGEDYKFAYKIKCEQKVDFNTNTITIVDKILSTRAKKVNEEIIKQLREIGKEKGINELILIDESKVLKMIKALEDFEWLKSVISIDMFDKLPTPEDKIRFLEIMGVKCYE